jgi:hypothetical protein
MLRQLIFRAIVICFAASASAQTTTQAALCLDGFCIGQSIKDTRFSGVEWIIAKDAHKETCTNVGCRAQLAFHGYSADDQKRLADAVSVIYGLGHYSIVTKDNLEALRHYRYECNLSQRGSVGGERRFFGAYLSAPSRHLTVIGLRLINGELRVYRIARQFPIHNQQELISLAKRLREQYHENLLLYDGISSNAYADVIEQKKNGWFGRSSVFNPLDLSDNAAELVLIDPKTRALLEPTSMPESGEIQPLRVKMVDECSQPVPIQ